MKRIFFLLLFISLSACSTQSGEPATNQAYLDAQKQIKTLSTSEYQILPDQSIYIGEFKNNTPEGFGKIISTDGSVYQGAIKNSKPYGFGKSIMSTGEIYEGEHKNGIFEGRGRLILSDGTTFIGTFKNHKVDRGEMFFTDGQRAISK